MLLQEFRGPFERFHWRSLELLLTSHSALNRWILVIFTEAAENIAASSRGALRMVCGGVAEALQLAKDVMAYLEASFPIC